MGIVTVSGEAGCRFEEVARISASRLGFELLTESRIAGIMEREFGSTPSRAYPDLVSTIAARLATSQHVMLTGDGLENLSWNFPGLFRVRIVAPENVREGNIMLDRRLDRESARQAISEIERQRKEERKSRFGRATPEPRSFDLALNAESLSSDQIADILETAIRTAGFFERGYLSAEAEAQLQFQIRLRLSRHGIAPSGQPVPKASFAHPSEEIFAHLLDFYRIPWEYEPKSFPVRWDADGRVVEAFTPDFFLPEVNLYVELTTMKQSLVTRKNRKVKLLKDLYPDVNIQVFYQKDFENLIFKYGLAERLTPA